MVKVLKDFLADSGELMYAPAAEKGVRRMAMVFALFGILGASVGIPFSGDNAYYIMLGLCTVFLLYKGGMKLSAPFAALYAVILLNVLVVDIPAFFRPFERAGLFILLTMVCSSALESSVAVKFRAYLFRYIIYGIIIIGVGSFFCFFLGINMMKSHWMDMSDFDSYATHGGRFSGLACHSMMLGPIAMIAAITFYFIYQRKAKPVYLACFFFAAMTTVLASSRAALLALILAIVYNLIMGKVNAKLRKRMIGILAVSAVLTIPLSDVVFAGMKDKHAARQAQSTSALDSRQDKWTYRIKEFESSPLFGVGFCAVGVNIGDSYSEFDGRVEPGTSHLSVLSMTGLAGFAVYLYILYLIYSNTKRINTQRSRFVMTCFIAMFVHAWFEGYILAGGGFLALLYWLIAGQCIDCPQYSRLSGHKLPQKPGITAGRGHAQLHPGVYK